MCFTRQEWHGRKESRNTVSGSSRIQKLPIGFIILMRELIGSGRGTRSPDLTILTRSKLRRTRKAVKADEKTL
ncbi:hypothetical protein D3I60_11050 [Brevibacterium permense]|nr:hypothetical protein [Brevibacterium permense]